ncbi:MAG: hypothetical protein AMS25_12820 [Gemmatimonas sp. SM23_52]|nr:MAG: hypothetical protein AMS25_12820 [Gemmatimonas sp. SM23_52]
MDLYTWDQLLDGGNSAKILAEIIGEPITTASVPSGWYSPKIAEAAAAAGIKVSFTSEPRIKVS